MAVEKKEEKMLVDKLKPKTEDEAATTISREMMEQVDVFELAAEMLKEEGTEYTFSLMAGGTWPMEINSQKAGIPRVHVRHEQAAAFAADAWGRLTRRPGVVIVGSGTCMTNAASGITQGYAAGSPMVILASDNSMVSDDRYSGMCIAHAEQQYAGITKWVRRVGNPQSFLYQLKRAFRSAVDHPSGPVCVATPGDMGGAVGASKKVPRIATQTLYTPGYWEPREWKTLADPDLIKRSLTWLRLSFPCGSTAAHRDFESVHGVCSVQKMRIHCSRDAIASKGSPFAQISRGRSSSLRLRPPFCPRSPHPLPYL